MPSCICAADPVIGYRGLTNRRSGDRRRAHVSANTISRTSAPRRTRSPLSRSHVDSLARAVRTGDDEQRWVHAGARPFARRAANAARAATRAASTAERSCRSCRSCSSRTPPKARVLSPMSCASVGSASANEAQRRMGLRPLTGSHAQRAGGAAGAGAGATCGGAGAAAGGVGAFAPSARRSFSFRSRVASSMPVASFVASMVNIGI